MNAISKTFLAALAAAAAQGCAGDGLKKEDAAAREAAYQQCLQDNMAVAMAWQAIEAMCREKTGTDDPLSK
jgi:hypothetical protein